MKKILITGGSGFVGSHLAKYLIEKNNYVICLDNFYTSSFENLKLLQENKNFKFIEHDICNSLNYDGDIDEIYNLASPASPIQYQKNPLFTVKTSVIGAINVCEFANSKNAKILQASTSEVYGDPLISPQIEKYWGNVNPVGLRSCYDEGKRCAETIFLNYKLQKDLVIKIIRIFNTYGPNMEMNDGRVISNFIVQALKNKDLTIYGNGLQTRSFQFIDDLVVAMVRVMNTENDFYGPINLGNPSEYTIIDLAKIIIELTGSKSKLVYKDLPSDDPKHRKPDIELAKSKLKWSPEYDLNEGLHKTIKYFKNKIKT